jgi:hypothetical protein
VTSDDKFASDHTVTVTAQAVARVLTSNPSAS